MYFILETYDEVGQLWTFIFKTFKIKQGINITVLNSRIHVR